MPYARKLVEDKVPLGTPGKFIIDTGGVAALAVSAVAIVIAAAGYDASGTESLLTGILAFVAARDVMPFRMK